MNNAAYDAVQEVWALTVKSRALCPYTGAAAIGRSGYLSPPWYLARGAVYFVTVPNPLTFAELEQLNDIGSFINRSFIISMSATLETFGIVECGQTPDETKPGAQHVRLTKWLRNHFAHGDLVFDPADAKHRRTRALMEELFPEALAGNEGFVLSIDSVLEPLKDGVLAYIEAAN